MYTDYRMTDENVNEYYIREHMIETVKKRFLTYGYDQVTTPAFETYELYANVTRSMNLNEMIKVIDHTGEILVLRPDVTIPITRQHVQDGTSLETVRKYFYIQDVFRQSLEQNERIEGTQAGVEYFGDRSPEADAEVIALACHILKDIGFKDIKIEMGHAGFFQEILNQLDLSEDHLENIKSMIQAKSLVDIGPYLKRISVDPEIARAIETIPTLYGDPEVVKRQAADIMINDVMTRKLDHLIEVYQILIMYGLKDHIVLDLGLINQMGYYSDMIFQGFVNAFGKPVLMGGRYDQLSSEFGASVPAIGFASQIDALVQALADGNRPEKEKVDIFLTYEEPMKREAILLTNALREKAYHVISLRADKSIDRGFHCNIRASNGLFQLQSDRNDKTLQTVDEVLAELEGGF